MTTRTDDPRLNPMNWDNLIDFQSQVLDPMTADELWEKALMDDNFVIREFCLGELRARQERAVDVAMLLLGELDCYMGCEMDQHLSEEGVRFVKSLCEEVGQDMELWEFGLDDVDDPKVRAVIRERMGFGGASE